MLLTTNEAQFLHKIVLENSLQKYFEAQARGVTADSFTEETPKAVWTFIDNYVRRYNRLPSLASVQEQVPVFTPGPVEDRVDYYTDKLVNQVKRNTIASFVQQLAVKVAQDSPDIVDFIGSTYTSLIRSVSLSDYGRLRDMAERINEYQHKVTIGESPMGIPTGIPELDNHFMGFRPGDYGVIAGRTGEGKTTIALYFAFSAFMAGKKVSYITLEMPREQIFEKLDALATRISVNKIRKLRLTEEELVRYQQKAQEISSIASDTCDIRVHDRTGDCSLSTVEAIINQDDCDILYIDQISLMKASRMKSNWEAIKEVSGELKQMALRYRKPIIVLSQVNRQGEEIIKAGDLPSIANLSYSDAVGQDADHAFVILGDRKTRHYHAKRFASIKLRGYSPIDLAVKWDPTTNFIEYLNTYANLRMPDANVQQMRQLQDEHSDPFAEQTEH